MAITKIHPIKSTINLAIDYITKSEKTDEKILVSSFKCHSSTAHIQFLKTRDDNDTKGTVLARHLIQSFLPGEVDPIKAHEIGMELCKKILKEDYEFVLATHIDRGHIHNHIIFNNVNYKTCKCYQSNKKTYHKIRYQSDELCKENKLSVIDEYYEAYKRKYKTAGKSWYEYDQNKKGNSWKSKLQFDIDRMINKSKFWEEFLENMKSLDYEIKFGKQIAFRHKDKQFAEEYYSELSVYKIAAKEILVNYKKLPNTKEILSNLDKLQEKKNTLMQEYSLNKEQFSYLVQYRKNYENYYGKEVER